MELFSIISHLIIQAKENPKDKKHILFTNLEDLKNNGLDIRITRADGSDMFTLYWVGRLIDFTEHKDKIKRSLDFFFDVYIDKNFVMKDIKITGDRRILCFNAYKKESLD